jgi:hypothetical protein
MRNGTSNFVKRILHPVLQSVTTLTSECNANPGMMWARCAAAGSLGRSSVHVRGLHLVSIWKMCDNGFVGKLHVGDGGAGGEELLVAPESKWPI